MSQLRFETRIAFLQISSKNTNQS